MKSKDGVMVIHRVQRLLVMTDMLDKPLAFGEMSHAQGVDLG